MEMVFTNPVTCTDLSCIVNQLLVFLLFIAIPTPFSNSKFLLTCILYVYFYGMLWLVATILSGVCTDNGNLTLVCMAL